jgi:hypothetical protein
MTHGTSVSGVSASVNAAPSRKRCPRINRSKLAKIAARSFLAIALMLSTANLPAQVARKAITNPAPPYPEVDEKVSPYWHCEGTSGDRRRRTHQIGASHGRLSGARRFRQRDAEGLEVCTSRQRNNDGAGVRLPPVGSQPGWLEPTKSPTDV